MHIHYLQHVPFEGLGSMESYFRAGGHKLSSTQLYLDHALPSPYDFDWLVIMGGPMGVHDEAAYAWLVKEKAFVRKAMDAGKAVLGICLGAQLIADVCGARVFKNKHPEIGWFPIHAAPLSVGSILAGVLPPVADAFHWHRDTFDIPPGGTLLASSKACKNQGFIIGDRVVGFQFHLETTPEAAAALIDNCGDERDGSGFVQSAGDIIGDPRRFARINALMASVLKQLEHHLRE